MKIIPTGFLIAMIFMAGFMTYILAHEATHLALSNEPYGICLGRCEYNSEQIMPEKGIAFAKAIGNHNKHSMQETIPLVVGLFATFWVIVIGIISLTIIQEEKEAKK